MLWLALMPYLANNSSEIRDVFDHNETVSKAYKELVEGVIAELPKEAQKQGFLFCDSIYYTANRIGAPMEIEVPDRRADGDRGQRSGSRRISHGSERDREGRV